MSKIPFLLLILMLFSSCQHVYRQSRLLPKEYSIITERTYNQHRLSSSEILRDIEENYRQQPENNSGNEYDFFAPKITITTPFLYPISRRSALSRIYIELGYAYLYENNQEAASIAFFSSLTTVRDAMISKIEKETIISDGYKGLSSIAKSKGQENYKALLDMIIQMEELLINHSSSDTLTQNFNRIINIVRKQQIEIEKTQDIANEKMIDGIATATIAGTQAYANIKRSHELGDHSSNTRDLIMQNLNNQLTTAASFFSTAAQLNNLADSSLVTDAQLNQEFVANLLNEYSKVDPFQTIVTKDAGRIFDMAIKTKDQILVNDLRQIVQKVTATITVNLQMTNSGKQNNNTNLADLVNKIKDFEIMTYNTERTQTKSARQLPFTGEEVK